MSEQFPGNDLNPERQFVVAVTVGRPALAHNIAQVEGGQIRLEHLHLPDIPTDRYEHDRILLGYTEAFTIASQEVLCTTTGSIKDTLERILRAERDTRHTIAENALSAVSLDRRHKKIMPRRETATKLAIFDHLSQQRSENDGTFQEPDKIRNLTRRAIGDIPLRQLELEERQFDYLFSTLGNNWLQELWRWASNADARKVPRS